MGSYIDYWNYNTPAEDFVDSLKINSTFFGSNVILFRGLPNWMVKNPFSGFQGEADGIPLKIEYNGREFGPFAAKPNKNDVSRHLLQLVNERKKRQG